MAAFMGLNIAVRSLMAHQQAIEVVSHNVANVNTPGYSRQRPVLVAEGAFGATGLAGMGVRMTQIQRINAATINRSLWMENPTLGKYTVLRDALQHVQAIISEPSESALSGALEDFWAGWRDLAGDPESMALRANVYEQADRLAGLMRTYAEQLEAYRRGLNTQVQQYAHDINRIATEIAELNKQIITIRSIGDQPNDLYDRRDALIDQLSELVNITYAEEENGSVSIFLGGHYLVMRDNAATINTVPDVGDPEMLQLVWGDLALEPVAPSSGKLAGVLAARDEVITQVLGALDELAHALATELNAVHNRGYGLDSSTGWDFFLTTHTVEGAAINLRVNPELRDHLERIATAEVPGAPGDARVATAIALLSGERLMDGGQSTFGDFYGRIVGQLGLDGQQAARIMESSRVLVDHLELRRGQVSGVSLDEEAVNLVQYQRAYQAAARVITVIDEMLERLMTMGLVGR